MSKGLGIMLAFLGFGGLILPFFGIQFKLLNLFGNSSVLVAILLIIIGGVLFFLSKK